MFWTISVKFAEFSHQLFVYNLICVWVCTHKNLCPLKVGLFQLILNILYIDKSVNRESNSTTDDRKNPNVLDVPLSKVPLAARTIWSAIAFVLE